MFFNDLPFRFGEFASVGIAFYCQKFVCEFLATSKEKIQRLKDKTAIVKKPMRFGRKIVCGFAEKRKTPNALIKP